MRNALRLFRLALTFDVSAALLPLPSPSPVPRLLGCQGISYGYGYFGEGYEGGRWQNGQFFYNRSVNNVNITNIHNVYNTTVVNSTTVNRVSYNGGNGGINVRPTPQEEAVAHERQVHCPAVEQKARGVSYREQILGIVAAILLMAATGQLPQ